MFDQIFNFPKLKNEKLNQHFYCYDFLKNKEIKGKIRKTVNFFGKD